MTLSWEQVLFAVWAALYASLSVWFYLHCVRPALVWNRATWPAHLVLGAMSIVPAAGAIIAPGHGAMIVPSVVAWLGSTAGWVLPRHANRLFGGPAPANRGLDTVLGWLEPAAGHLDVGDLRAARVQVEAAREHSTPETRRYVELWHALVDEEQRRRDGEQISRIERLKAIQEEHARLVLDPSQIPNVTEGALVVGIGVVVLASVLTTLVGV